MKANSTDESHPLFREQFYVPSDVFASSQSDEYMAHPYPVAADFYHPKFSDFLRRFNNHPFQMHRKLWEYAFIEYHLSKLSCLQEGKKGLCFGVGQEPLPALLANRGCSILATDAAPESVGAIWSKDQQFSRTAADLNYDGMIDKATFESLVSYETCDMNNIGSHLKDFDFCWSACCLEHLGSLRHGLDFILKSLDALKIGGIACHTTELNLSSDIETLETGGTVLYRRRDLEAFFREVENLGHKMEPIKISPMASPIDHFVDIPPYSHNPHLKLLLCGYVTTSVGIVIQKTH